MTFPIDTVRQLSYSSLMENTEHQVINEADNGRHPEAASNHQHPNKEDTVANIEINTLIEKVKTATTENGGRTPSAITDELFSLGIESIDEGEATTFILRDEDGKPALIVTSSDAERTWYEPWDYITECDEYNPDWREHASEELLSLEAEING